jgi:hypothetical protein
MARAETKPVAVVGAVPAALELHATTFVKFSVLPSLNVPVALSCCFSPSGIVGEAGVTAIETSDATLIASAPLIEPDVAVTVAIPLATAVARPVDPTVTTVIGAELQVAEAVRSCLLPSLNVPVALSWTKSPGRSERFVGPTAIETNVGAVTVSI